MPASMARSRSSLMTWAVSATIHAWSPRSRRRRVVSKPSMPGIWISMNTRSNAPAAQASRHAWPSAVSAASRPRLASMRRMSFWFTGLSSTTRTRAAFPLVCKPRERDTMGAEESLDSVALPENKASSRSRSADACTGFARRRHSPGNAGGCAEDGTPSGTRTRRGTPLAAAMSAMLRARSASVVSSTTRSSCRSASAGPREIPRDRGSRRPRCRARSNSRRACREATH